MKNTILTFCCILLQQSLFAENKDWLIDGSPYKTEVNLSSDKKQIELTNGLLRRSFSLTPNGATIALDNLMTGQNELRAVRPEAVLVINGKEYPVGGLEGQPVHNFLTPRIFCQGKDQLIPCHMSEERELIYPLDEKLWLV